MARRAGEAESARDLDQFEEALLQNERDQGQAGHIAQLRWMEDQFHQVAMRTGRSATESGTLRTMQAEFDLLSPLAMGMCLLVWMAMKSDSNAVSGKW